MCRQKKVPFLPETDKLEEMFFQNSQSLTHFHRGPGEEQFVGSRCSQRACPGNELRRKDTGHFESLI